MTVYEMNRTELSAVRLYPELKGLIELRQSGGWVFSPVVVGGTLEVLAGCRVWLSGWSDAITIRSETDARAFRCNSIGGVVWKRESTLSGVLEALVELPVPDAHGAPHLVIGRSPTLWRPGVQ